MTEFDMSRMQQDAVNRVRDMQRRAKKSVESVKENADRDKSVKQEGFIRKDNTDKKENLPKNQSPPKNKGFDILRMFNFSKLEEDSDRSLILLILILLAGDGCDETLIFALIYLLI